MLLHDLKVFISHLIGTALGGFVAQVEREGFVVARFQGAGLHVPGAALQPPGLGHVVDFVTLAGGSRNELGTDLGEEFGVFGGVFAREELEVREAGGEAVLEGVLRRATLSGFGGGSAGAREVGRWQRFAWFRLARVRRG